MYAIRSYYAIARDEAFKVIGDLRDGKDVTSIGVNGAAIANVDFSGVWVSSVETGTPAHVAGIRDCHHRRVTTVR